MCFFTAYRDSQEAVVICTRVVKVDVNFIVFKNLGAKPAFVTVFAPAAFSRRRGIRRRNRSRQGYRARHLRHRSTNHLRRCVQGCPSRLRSLRRFLSLPFLATHVRARLRGRSSRRRNRRLQGAWLSPEVAVCQSG